MFNICNQISKLNNLLRLIKFMYGLFIATFIYIYYIIYEYFIKIDEIYLSNTFKSDFELIKVDIYINNELLVSLDEDDLETTNLINYNNNDSSIELLDKSMYIIVTYYFDESQFKVLIYGNELKFPLYSNEQLENHSYIKRIDTAKLLLDNDEIDIKDFLIQYVGPNYNFHSDINNIKVKDILINYSDVYKLTLTDSFGAEYVYKMDDFLQWSPTLI